MWDKIFSIGLLVLSMVLPFSIALSSLAFFPLFGFWILGGYWTFKKWPAEWGLTEKAYVAFLGISFLSAIAGMDVRHSLHEIWKKDFYFLILVLTVALTRDRKQIERLVRWFVIAGVLSAVFGLFQRFLGLNSTDKGHGYLIYVPDVAAHWPRWAIDQCAMIYGRVAGTRSHPLTYAEGLLFVLSFLLASLAWLEDRSWRWIISIWICGAALAVSQSRGAWLSAGVLALLAFSGRMRPATFGKMVLMGFPVFLLLGVPNLRHRLRSIGDMSDNSNLERLHMWHAGNVFWRAHPFLGIGPGNVKQATPPFQNPEEARGGGWGHLHSTCINFAAERGTLGLVAYLFMIGALVFEIGRGLRKCEGDPKGLAILWGCLLGIAGFMLSGLTETTYNASVISMNFFFIAGLGLALARRP